MLCDGQFNNSIEEAVSRSLGRDWRISEIRKNTEGAMHDAAFFSGNGYNVFVKAGSNPFSPDQFRQEAKGLEYISAHSSVLTPEVIGVYEDNGVTLLVLEAIDAKIPETKDDWAVLGRGLAALHKSTSETCGLDFHTYLGIFRQENKKCADWPEYYGNMLIETMQKAIDKNNMTPDMISMTEKLIGRLPELCGPKQPFSLLHGDPWVGNLLYDGKKLILIDCSIYYGNREMDLSTVSIFKKKAPDYFFDAYNEAYPIEKGYSEREGLWRINQWLGHVTLFGEKFHERYINYIKEYL